VFLITAIPHDLSSTLGNPKVGVLVKQRQLAPTAGKISDDLLMDSIATFDFTNTPKKATTIIFGSWIYVADGLGGFTSHLAEP